MRNLIRVAVLAVSVLALAGCGGNGESIVDKVQAGVAKSCDFLADYGWLTDVVSKMDITLATVNAAVSVICQGVENPASSTQLGIVGDEKKVCLHGEIIVDGEAVCIEGQPIE